MEKSLEQDGGKKMGKLASMVLVLLVLFIPLADIGQAYVGQGSNGATRGYWRFNDHGDQQADDTSGRGNHGTLVNDPTWTSSGKFGYALDFDSLDDYVEVPDSESLDITGALTIELWLKPSSLSSYKAMVTKGNAQSENINYGLQTTSESVTGIPRFFIHSDGYNYVDANSAISTDAWTHLAVTYNDANNEVKFFINGNLDASRTFTYSLPTSTYPLYIGKHIHATAGSSQYFDGVIEEVRILDFERTGFSGGVMLYEAHWTGTDKWIGICNHGDTDVDIRGWVFYNDTGIKLLEFTGSHVVTTGSYEALYEHDYAGIDNLSATDSIRVYDLDPENDGNPVAASYTNLVDFVAWGTSCPCQCDEDTDDAVKAGLWTKNSYESSTGYDTVYLYPEKRNDRAVEDWSAKNAGEPAPPVPDVTALILLASGLVLVLMYFVYGRRRRGSGYECHHR